MGSSELLRRMVSSGGRLRNRFFSTWRITRTQCPTTCFSYTRATWMYRRRSIGRWASDAFGNFPRPEMILWPTLDRLPSDDLSTNAKSLRPGTLDAHLPFPTVYRRARDNCSVEMMSSPEGIHWFLVPRNPVIVGDPEPNDEGRLFTSCGLVPLPGGSVGLPFDHKDPRWRDRNDRRVTCYALWNRERLVCVEAAGEGEFTPSAFRTTGRELRLGFKAPFTGEIRVAVFAVTQWVHKKRREVSVKGRNFEDGAPFRGDLLSQVVTWRGRPDLGRGGREAVCFRFWLRASRLYAFTVS